MDHVRPLRHSASFPRSCNGGRHWRQLGERQCQVYRSRTRKRSGGCEKLKSCDSGYHDRVSYFLPFAKQTRFAAVFILYLFTVFAQADDWPQWRGPNRDGVWRETGVVQRLPEQLTFRWKTPIGGGFAGPAVVGDRVYVADRAVADKESVPESRWNVTDPVNGSERILCLDGDTGKILWKHEYKRVYTISYPIGPRATPTVAHGKVYSVGAMGDLVCLDADRGAVIWSKNYPSDFGTQINPWGMASAPLVDGQQLIILAGGENGACVLALDKDTGDEIWRSLDAVDPGYSSPILIEAGGTRQLIVWNPLGLYSLDPASGKVNWHQPFATKMGHSVATPVYNARHGRLFVSSFFDGPLMMQLSADSPTAEFLWKGSSQSELARNTDKLHALMCTPSIVGDRIYGVCSYGQLRCLDAGTGRRIWETLEATGEGRWWTAFLVQHQGRFFIFNEQGELIIARLSSEGYEEISRAPLIAPTHKVGRRMVVWSHPAFANRRVYARNDREIVCADLAQ
ncbi:MAG: PQQ-binding-like beta-propeller repeat protein [Pirellulaceae bacterium]